MKTVTIGDIRKDRQRLIATDMGETVIIEFHRRNADESWEVAFVEVAKEQAVQFGFGLVEMVSQSMVSQSVLPKRTP